HQSQLEGDLVHSQMLRSGQSINHVGGDVILTKGINAGAEAITDYSLHVYGKAEGRLVAGATGDTNAKIFCLRFNPSLVSVAGTYCLKENIPTEYLDKAVQVSYLDGQGLVFELME
ncbi:MAG: septum site-determining protein MinC, partial [Moraxella sp.]